ncbi:MAG: carbon starvation CstA family protein, partial [bacterium]
MNLLVFLFMSFVVRAAAYRVIGNYLARVFALSREEGTPAHVQRDGLDYEPIRASYLLPQHFSAIAAAGPIVGPILAALYFGWGPAWLWILLGSVFIGGVHDFTALVASVRHKGRSVAEIVSRYMNRRAYILFLIFVWSALVYVIVAFADVTAGAFVQAAISSEGAAPGPAVATSSAIYLLLAVFMGLALKYTKLGPVRAKMIFLPLVAVAIIVGPYIPIDLSGIVPAGKTQQVWGYVLLGYCFVAAMVPVWILLQPRGELGGYFLYIVMIAGVVGVAIGTMTGEVSIAQPFFKGWTYEMPTGG